ncbi:MAG: histidine kinase [Bacteroidota bacterium]
MSTSTTPIVTPYFKTILFGLWVFFTIAFGVASTWIFSQLMPDNNEMGVDGFMYSAVYAGCFISLFGITWKTYNRWFPIHKPFNLVYHGLMQSLNSLVGFTIGFFITQSLHAVLTKVEEADQTKSEIGLAVIAMFCLIGTLMTNGYFYASSYLRRSLEAEKMRSDSELSALRSQINPHFLFNSLNSIAALVRIDPNKAEDVTQDLADLFRYTLRASDRAVVTLREELETIELYANIEKARFKERLSFVVQVPEHLLSIQVPILVLQPLVENAIKHGVNKKEGKHQVDISIHAFSPELLEIKVMDTGPGFQLRQFEEVIEKGTGLTNVFKRLRLHYGEQVDGSILDNGIALRIPYDASSITPLEQKDQSKSNSVHTYESVPG